MSPAATIERLDREIRAAVGAGDLSLALGLWREYAGELAANPAAGRLEEARALIDWTRQACLAGHARLADELSALRVCLKYSEAPASARPIVRMRG